MTLNALHGVDAEVAERAAEQVVLAYEIADVMSDYASNQSDEHKARAIMAAQIVCAFNMRCLGVSPEQATASFAKLYDAVCLHVKRYGAGVRLRDVIVELSLDHS